MFDFLKTLGEGVMFTLLSPIILALLVIHMAICVIIFFVMFIKRIIMFFQGKDMSITSELDKAAKYHLQMHKKALAAKHEQGNAPQQQPVQTVLQPIILQTDRNGVIHNVNNEATRQQPTRTKQEPLDMSTKEISFDALVSSKGDEENE